jgi:hypothetical protein
VALLAAGAATFAMAQDQAPPASPTPMAGPHAMHGPRPHGDWKPDMHGMHGMHGEDIGVIADLRELERLYRQAGRSKDLVALYNDVLAKSQDPRVRAYAYHHLARAQAQPANLDAAIATLRKGLDEDLANEAKHRAEMEQMRARWQQKQADAAKAGGK